MLALVEDFLFRILWIFNLSVGNHVLRLVSNDIIATVAGVLEIVRLVTYWNTEPQPSLLDNVAVSWLRIIILTHSFYLLTLD